MLHKLWERAIWNVWTENHKHLKSQYLHELMPMRMTWEIFRQNVYVWFASAAIASQFTTNSDGGYGRAQRISTFELHSKHLMDDPERSQEKNTAFDYCRIFEFYWFSFQLLKYYSFRFLVLCICVKFQHVLKHKGFHLKHFFFLIFHLL